MTLNFSNDQIKAYDAVMEWFKKPKDKYFVLSGYAGTGKTTIAKYIAEEIGIYDVIFCAYTGKAANVLREKGCTNAGTIHSFLYKFIYDQNGRNPVFGINPESPLKYAKLVIVDEWSMLGDEMIQDLFNNSVKILFLGDPFQLPPVKANQTLLKADCFIEEIHRQARESPILRAATAVREGREIPLGKYGEFDYIRSNEATDEIYMAADQLIVGMNKTRQMFNQRFRRLRGYRTPQEFEPGEKIICLQNNREQGLFNGMIGKCVSSHISGPTSFQLDFECDGNIYSGLPVWRGDIDAEVGKSMYDRRSRFDRFDYADAITCHKSQGSEFDTVVLFKEPIGDNEEMRRRWIYTGITRAKTKLTMIQA